MSAKIEIRRGRTFLLPGTWGNGEPFTAQTSMECKLIRLSTEIVLSVTLELTGEFEIYASNVDTAGWVPGIYDAVLTRTDVGFLPNGDDLVDSLEPFGVEII